MSADATPLSPSSAFHFSGSSVVDEQLAADIAVAGAFSVPQLVAVAGLVLDSLRAPKVWSLPLPMPLSLLCVLPLLCVCRRASCHLTDAPSVPRCHCPSPLTSSPTWSALARRTA